MCTTCKHQRRATTLKLQVKVIPGASRDEIVGLVNQTLRVRVVAPPERGKANAAAVRLIADVLHLPSSAVRVVAGHGSRLKIVEIDGLEAGDLAARLS